MSSVSKVSKLGLSLNVISSLLWLIVLQKCAKELRIISSRLTLAENVTYCLLK